MTERETLRSTPTTHNDTVPPITSAKDYLRQAHKAFNRRDLEKTREALRAALAFQPEDSELILALGHVEFGMGRYAMALERYAVVCEMHPDSAEALASRALTLTLLNRSGEARAFAERALAIHPRDLVALKVMARLSLDGGCHEKARGFCRRILNINPIDSEALKFLDQCQFDLDAFLEEAPVQPEKNEAQIVPLPPVRVDTVSDTVLVPFPQ